jgi:hypothetical protein
MLMTENWISQAAKDLATILKKAPATIELPSEMPQFGSPPVALLHRLGCPPACAESLRD